MENIPVPDPSEITRQEIERLRIEIHRSMASQREILEARLDAMDTANKVLNEAGLRELRVTAGQIGHLKELHDEKFESIQKQFIERDVRIDQGKASDKIAIDAAFLAQKAMADTKNESNAEAIKKSETQTIEQIRGLQTLIKSNDDRQNDRVADLKSRLDRGEASVIGASDNSAKWMAAAALGIAALIGMYQFLQHSVNPAPAVSAPAVSAPAQSR